MYSFKFADIGEGIHEGVIHQWLVKENETIKEGQTLFMVETDKVNAEIPSPVDGVVAAIHFQVGETIHVGDVAVDIDDGKGGTVTGDQTKSQAHKPTPSPQKPHTESVEEAGSTSVVGEIEVSSDLIPSSDEAASQVQVETKQQKVLATPVARKMAKDLKVDIQTIKGTGPAGRVMKSDIQAAHDQIQSKTTHAQSKPAVQEQMKPLEVQEGEVTRVKMTMLRKTIANTMVKSKFTIPHTAAMDEADATALVAYRKKLNDQLKEKDLKLTFMPFIIKAVSIALKMHPIVNSSLDEATDEIILKHSRNIGIATDTPDGLMVPVLKHADQLSLLEIANQLAYLGEAAKARSLKLSEMEGGTFTITNYGSIGALYGVPVIKFPEAAILGIGTIHKKPAVNHDGEIVVQDALPLSISFDHRIVDGADAGRFLQSLKQLLENPDWLLIN